MILQWFSDLFSTNGFPPRWQCGTGWTGPLGWTHVISDALIFIAYTAIPVAIGVFAMRRRDVPFPLIAWLFFAFILLCGITHLLEAIIFWLPVYRLSALFKALTAVVSITTVLAVIRVAPKLYSIPDLQLEHQTVRAELARCEEDRQRLDTLRKQLEERSVVLTMRDYRMRHAMLASEVAAVHWWADTLHIDWHIGLSEILHMHESLGGGLDSWTDFLASGESERLRAAQSAVLTDDSRTGFTIDLVLKRTDAQPGVTLRMRVEREQMVKGEGPAFTGMLRVVKPEHEESRRAQS